MRIEPSAVLQKSAPSFPEQELCVSALEYARALALMRLIAVLLISASEERGCLQISPLSSESTLSLLSRLRAAHAVYTLATGTMRRVGAGAWVRRRLN